MKSLSKFILILLLGLASLMILVSFSSYDYLLKGLWASYLHGNNSATIDDAKFFNTNKIDNGDSVWNWPLKEDYNKFTLSNELNSVLENTNSVAFLIIKNDSIAYEQYWENYSDSSLSNSFSMAKSIVTMLTQIAIQREVLSGWNQKVKDILPELKGEFSEDLELWNLSTMSSGLYWDEHYKNPFSVTAQAYYGSDLNELMYSLPINEKPGTRYNYQSGSTQLLGMVLMKATGKPLGSIASEWLWKPLQAKYDSKWHTDSKGVELAYCCFNSNARDFARFGKLMLNNGKWENTQILDSSFTVKATQPALSNYYGYSFWLNEENGTKIFYQRGILGQYIIVIPEKNLVIVRLGHKRLPNLPDHHPEDFHIIVKEVLKISNLI